MIEQPGRRFGHVAEEYERVRPSYPPRLIERACALAGLRPRMSVVEIGCGTGKLTRDLAARGLAVEAVEPDAGLIEVARTVVPGSSVRFHEQTFEEVVLRRSSFRAVFAATSFHWIDPAVGWRKVASLLAPEGMFALLSHVGGLQGGLDDELLRVWHEVVPESVERWKPVPDQMLWSGVDARMENVSELWSWLTRHELVDPKAGELFADVRLDREPFELELSVDDYLDRLHTSNSYLHLEPERQERLDEGLAAVLERHGGIYPARSFATLVTARRAT